MAAEIFEKSGSQRVRREAGRRAKPTILTSGEALREAVLAAKRAAKRIGLVPTMGALHEGHLSLLDAAQSECDFAVATIFVNPTQFAPQEDFQHYPRDLDRDVSLLSERGCDLVFAPPSDEMYASDHSTFVDVGQIGQALEGEFRPTHFRGVATVVLKLFQLAPAEVAYFGRKDYQQTIVIRQMVRDLNVPMEVRVCPTVREPDGLAMSSRNAYLNAEERKRALAIWHSLQLAERLFAEGERSAAHIRARMERELRRAGGIEVQYIAFVEDGTVTPVEGIDGPTTIAIAAKVGRTRLIDNVLLGGN
jgi:pantoate--beta-alanine ligase